MVRHGQSRLLLALFVVVILLLQFPAIAVVEALRATSGASLVFFYVFGVWAAAIVGAALILERRGG